VFWAATWIASSSIPRPDRVHDAERDRSGNDGRRDPVIEAQPGRCVCRVEADSVDPESAEEVAEETTWNSEPTV